jgi:hypothetical protein
MSMSTAVRDLSVAPGGKTAAAALLVAAIGVILQILGGANYPAVPPVFFILLIPAALVAFGRWWWTPVPVVLAGLFLTFGTFASGEAHRLIDSSLLDAAGLWLQLLAVVVATLGAAGMTIRTYRARDVGRFVRRTRTILAKRTVQVMGAVFLAFGIVGFVAGAQDFELSHNLLHFLTGVLALTVGLAGTVPLAQIGCVALGGVYVALGVGGMALGEPGTGAWNTGLFTVAWGDHIFHSLIGLLFLAGGLLTDRGQSWRRHRT